MNRSLLSCAAALVAACLAGPSFAADDWTVTLQVATDYVSKGISKNDSQPAVSGSVEQALGKAYVGAWASNADTSAGADAEIQLYAGFKPEFGGVKWDVRGFYKTLPGTSNAVQQDLFEARVDANKSIGATKLRLRVEYSPDSYAATEAAWWVEGQVSHPLSKRVVASAGVARREQDGGADYTAWNAGATIALNQTLALDLRYYDTDAHGLGDNYDSRAFAALTARF